ncbi:NAD(P)-binding protein [Variovorax dokdonensis]|uniref:NAD(P)-binding protein n=1 Tax=Variovorax dokdonensis TaxID=344883 RepID=A0ABT7NDE8_9BURK|nr:FAD-dependent oxidoreductase [Variovorax dokdonensis]MDM0045953.1 NAD(P)-binding protein [Variovorax dokdonensis]
MTANHRPMRVAIVGGGVAGMTAAWQLTRHIDECREAAKDGKAGEAEQFVPPLEVTVYERSFRLGGKGGSGRDAAGRIREHGLHIWLGFYENAFKMMRDCYGMVTPEHGPLPHRTFDDAYFPEPHIGVATRMHGAWEVWSGFLPPMKGMPGDPLDDETNPFTLSGYLARCVALSKALILSLIAPASGKPGKASRSALDEALELNLSFDAMRSPGVMLDSMTQLLRVGTLTTAAGVLQALTIVENWLREHNPAPQFTTSVLAFIEALVAQVRRQLEDVVSVDPQVRQKTQVIDLIMTIMVGLYRDRVLFDPKGLDAINEIDCMDWLRKHGAMRESVDSPFVLGLYDLAFCFREGDRSKPALAAGQALRGALRMFFTYRGSLFWRMRSGMGDAMFSPLYSVLKRRGVRFRLAHELESIDFTPDLGKPEARVQRLTFKLPCAKAQVAAYSDDALDKGGGWAYEKPEALAGQSERIELHDGEDFDMVIFAMGIDDFRALCHVSDEEADKRPGLFRCLPRWDAMQRHVKTVGTQSAQVWLDRSATQLGWMRGPGLVSALEPPFESWGDLSDTFEAEQNWRDANGIETVHETRSIAYFTGVLSDKDIREHGGNEERLRKLVRDNLYQKLTRGMATLWPAATGDVAKPEESPVLKALVGLDGKPLDDLKEALEQQHMQANFKGSERYTLAMPGTIAYRISPLDLSVANMTIAGDWTECSFNEGCVEAAVMSGMLASHAICGFPALADIVGYDHP